MTAPRANRRLDPRLALAATGAVIAFGVLVAALILVATGRGGKVDPNQPVNLGLASALHTKIADGGPVFFADPQGGEGLWLALEDGKLVALAPDLPGPKRCVVAWRGSRNAFVDCNGRKVPTREIDRYRTRITTSGTPEGAYLVYLRERITAPARAASTTTTRAATSTTSAASPSAPTG